MSTELDERLFAYREPLEDAIEARRQHPAPTEVSRRWSIIAPLVGAIATTTIGAVVVLSGDRNATAPAPGDDAVTSDPATPPTASATPQSAAPTALAPPPSVLAIGDAVMLGAVDELTAQGIVVNTEVSRQMRTMIPTVQQLRDAGQLGDTVVVHLGTNGTLDDQTVTEFFAALSGVPRVLVLTIRAPREYVAANNDKLAALPTEFPNVQLLDWSELSNNCPGDCLYDDGIHLSRAGQTYYTELITNALGL